MKTLSITLIVLICSILLNAQPPQAFKYQAVVRDNSGEILQNQSVGIRINIHDATAGGTIVYQETFSETTNQFGLVNLEIGTGTPTSGTFSGIDWGSDAKFIEVEIDATGGGYVSMGTSELLAVPYALYSERSKDAPWEISGNEIFYNDGNVGIGTSNPAGSLDVRGIGTDDGAVINLGNSDLSHKLTLFGGKETDPNPFLMWKDGDPFRFVTDAAGFSEKMRITSDGNVGIGTSSPGATLDVVGHIWQTGTGESVFVGEGAGAYDDLSDNQNVFIGYNAGNANTTGSSNIAMGVYALYLNTDKSNLVAVGDSVLFYNGNGSTNSWESIQNTALGSKALLSNTIGNDNTAIGYKSLYSNTTGWRNTATGSYALYHNTTGYYNTASGYYALCNNTTGLYNTANGSSSLRNNTEGDQNTATGSYSLRYNITGNNNTANGYATLLSNTIGIDNTASGYYSLYLNTTGYYNTASGSNSLYSNTEGASNTAIGYESLYHNTTGYYNTASGSNSLYSNTTGHSNTANGTFSLHSNTIGIYNTATGYYSLYSNTEGSANTAIGFSSLRDNTVGYANTALGRYSLLENISGHSNTACGYQSLSLNTTGFRNTAIGFESLSSNETGDNNTAIGYYSLFSNLAESYNTAVGDYAYSNGNYSNSTALGHNAQPGASNTVMLGNSSITWIGGHSTWHNTSDSRMKNNILEDVKGLDFIMELRPVTYYFDIDRMNALIGVTDSSDYAEKYDKEKIKQSGFLAQEVEQAAKKSGYDFSGVSKPKGDVKYYSLAYAEFVVPLVKAVQEQQALIEKQQLINEEQQIVIEKLKSRIEKLERSK